MMPGASLIHASTRLKVLAQHVLKTIAPDQVDAIGRKVEEGLLDLAELDRLSVEVASLGTAAIKLVFQTTAVEPVALSFVSSDAYDAKIVTQGALPFSQGEMDRKGKKRRPIHQYQEPDRFRYNDLF